MSSVLDLARAKKVHYAQQRSTAYDKLNVAVQKSSGLLAELEHVQKAYTAVVSHERKKIAGFKAALQRLVDAANQANGKGSDGNGNNGSGIEFADPAADLRLVQRQADAHLKKIRAASKRRRTTLLKTLKALGDGD